MWFMTFESWEASTLRRANSDVTGVFWEEIQAAVVVVPQEVAALEVEVPVAALVAMVAHPTNQLIFLTFP